MLVSRDANSLGAVWQMSKTVAIRALRCWVEREAKRTVPTGPASGDCCGMGIALELSVAAEWIQVRGQGQAHLKGELPPHFRPSRGHWTFREGGLMPQLPKNIGLENLRKQAKTLLKDYRAGVPKPSRGSQSIMLMAPVLSTTMSHI